MIEFEKPNIECLEVDDANNYAKFVCEPLERGYGVTIGNSLRRILLSSLTGCAITSIKIEGVLHEFSSIPNVVEDVPEIIVNLKNVRLKFAENEEKVMRINFKGEGEVTAADIVTDGTVEILNPDLHIATVSEGGQLIMELTADMGRGYSPSEKNKKPNQDISVLPIDSIYTPVKKVNYQVKNTRVGQMVDYDKLIIEVWTDGSLKAHEALSLAAKVMTGHLELFIIIALLSAIFMIYFFTKTKSREVLTRFGLVLTFAGMAGNLIDRIVLGYVRDFIDFVIFNYKFPIFNIADIAVVIGVILIIFEIIFEERIHGKN